MKIIYHGHSCISIHHNDYKLIVDPFLSENPKSSIKESDKKVDYILLTHAHNDHFGDTIQMAKDNQATVIANVEICNFLEKMHINTHPMNLGGAHLFPFGNLKMTIAFHSSSLQLDNKEITMGTANGFLLEINNNRIYLSGDTALFTDLKLYSPIDIAFLPIGDNFTMGISDAAKACDFLDAKLMIPMHYDTFPIIKANPKELKNFIEPHRLKIMKSGDILNF